MSLFRRVRLLLDRRSAEEVEQGTKEALERGTDPRRPTQNLSRTERAMQSVRRVAVRVGAAIAAAFAIRAVTRFARSAVDAAVELERSRRTLAATLRGEGIAWENVSEQVRQTTRDLWETHRLTEGEVNPILQSLVLATQDYERSLDAVGVAADLAAATNMDASRAAQLLGRAMNGELTVLRRYGIEIEEGADVVEVLRERLNGMAAEATPWSAVMSKAWGDFKEEIGETLIEMFHAEDGASSLTDTIREMTDWVHRNREEFRVWGQRILTVVREVAQGTARLFGWVQSFVQRVADEIAVTWEFVHLRILQGRRVVMRIFRRDTEEVDRAIAQSRAMIDRLREAMSDTRDTTAEAADEAERLASGFSAAAQGAASAAEGAERIRSTLEDLEGFQEPGLTGVPDATATHDVPAGERIRTPEMVLEAQTRAVDMFADHWVSSNQEIVAASHAAARGVASAWEDAFSAMMVEGEGVGMFFEALFRGVASAGLGALATYASEKVALNVAEAIEQFARSLGWSFLNPGQAAASAASAKQHLAAAAAWGAIGGASGAAQSAVGGGGRAALSGGLHRGATDPTGRMAERFGRDGPDINIHISGVDPKNPRHQELIGQTSREYQERYGGRIRVRGS